MTVPAQFSKLVMIEVARANTLRAVGSVREAAEQLLGTWPTKGRGAAYKAASRLASPRSMAPVTSRPPAKRSSPRRRRSGSSCGNRAGASDRQLEHSTMWISLTDPNGERVDVNLDQAAIIQRRGRPDYDHYGVHGEGKDRVRLRPRDP